MFGNYYDTTTFNCISALKRQLIKLRVSSDVKLLIIVTVI